MRGATFPSRLHSSLFLFLLTHLMRGATFSRFIFIVLMSISTHAPHARCNLQYGIMITVRGHFYSRTSCEVQRLSLSFSNVTSNFYSRTSCEVQPLLRTTKKTTSYFYSRTSCEVQHCLSSGCKGCIRFLLTHLMRGATLQPLPFRQPH